MAEITARAILGVLRLTRLLPSWSRALLRHIDNVPSILTAIILCQVVYETVKTVCPVRRAYRVSVHLSDRAR